MFALIRRHPRLTLSLGAAIAFVSCPVLIVIVAVNNRVSGKSGAWHSPDLPAARSGVGQPILQLEFHTCDLPPKNQSSCRVSLCGSGRIQGAFTWAARYWVNLDHLRTADADPDAARELRQES